MTQFRSGYDSRIGDFHTMVHFVFFLQATQNRNRSFYAWLTHDDALKAALQCRIFLNIFAIFIQRRRAHAMQLAARERGLEHVAGIHRTFSLASAYHRVELVDENNGLTFIFG